MSTCPINPPGHDWANGLTCRCGATRTAGEAIVSGLASRVGADDGTARVLLDAYRAEVRAATLAEAVAEAEQTASGFSTDSDWGSAAVGVLRGLAYRLRQLAGRPDLPRDGATAGFQRGHTYESGRWQFKCRTIDRQPDGGKPCAVGWLRPAGDQGWTLYHYDLDQWSPDWVDVTEAGAR